MKKVKGWDDEEDGYALLTSHTNKRKYKNSLKEDVHIVESMDTKQCIAPTRKAIKLKVSSGNPVRNRCTILKESKKERCIQICPKYSRIIVENMAIMHVTVQDHVIAQENEQNQEFTNMMDLDNTSVSKECAMVCMDVHYEDWDWDIIMYGDQGVCTKEHNEATYTELAVKKNKKLNIMWPYALVILCHLRKMKAT